MAAAAPAAQQAQQPVYVVLVTGKVKPGRMAEFKEAFQPLAGAQHSRVFVGTVITLLVGFSTYESASCTHHCCWCGSREIALCTVLCALVEHVTKNEPGCLTYVLSTGEDPDTLCIYE
jgi:quinol monooxygenase YgiN